MDYSQPQRAQRTQRLFIDQSEGKEFIIAKAGKPMVKVSPLTAEDAPLKRRLGFMIGEISVLSVLSVVKNGRYHICACVH
jgi:antitoxin (DNA-binding transcriptional repressor) of toxin-antitoxin stability system